MIRRSFSDVSIYKVIEGSTFIWFSNRSVWIVSLGRLFDSGELDVEAVCTRNCCNLIVGLHIYSLIDVLGGTQGYYYSNRERLTVSS